MEQINIENILSENKSLKLQVESLLKENKILKEYKDKYEKEEQERKIKELENKIEEQQKEKEKLIQETKEIKENLKEERKILNDTLKQISENTIKEKELLTIKKIEERKLSKGNKKKERKTIPKPLRDNVWTKHNGQEFKGNCFCCDKEIDINNFEAGHILAVDKGGLNTLDNLRPICSTCNRSMGIQNMFDFMKEFGFDKLKEHGDKKEELCKSICKSTNQPCVYLAKLDGFCGIHHPDKYEDSEDDSDDNYTIKKTIIKKTKRTKKKPKCIDCKEEFTQKTLDKYDSNRCGKCYNSLFYKQCKGCQGIFTTITLDKYDGKNCGRCYSKL